MTISPVYQPGRIVTFRDKGYVAMDELTKVQHEGMINGEAIETQDHAVYVPVWVERDRGREPTTVYVHGNNIVSVRDA